MTYVEHHEQPRGPGYTLFLVPTTPILDLVLAGGFQQTDATFGDHRATISAVWTIEGLHGVGGHQKDHLDRGGGLRRRHIDAGVDVPATRPGRTSAAPARPSVVVDAMKRP